MRCGQDLRPFFNRKVDPRLADSKEFYKFELEDDKFVSENLSYLEGVVAQLAACNEQTKEADFVAKVVCFTSFLW